MTKTTQQLVISKFAPQLSIDRQPAICASVFAAAEEAVSTQSADRDRIFYRTMAAELNDRRRVESELATLPTRLANRLRRVMSLTAA